MPKETQGEAQHLGTSKKHIGGVIMTDQPGLPRKEDAKFAGGERRYPLVICHIAIEHGHRNSEFSHEKW